ncbi:MAG TPA: hypothetical protein DCE13_04625, partial [Cryomorphaceae bacterium]|nr:hypothetical protein [Cryomorphaceae bacterium]
HLMRSSIDNMRHFGQRLASFFPFLAVICAYSQEAKGTGNQGNTLLTLGQSFLQWVGKCTKNREKQKN